MLKENQNEKEMELWSRDWAESFKSVSRGSQVEKAMQNAIIRRGKQIVEFMRDGYSREEADKLAGDSCLGARSKRMLEHFIKDWE